MVARGRKLALPSRTFACGRSSYFFTPVTPFITEELWHLLGFSEGQSIQHVNPENGNKLRKQIKDAGIDLDESALTEMMDIRELVTSMRALKAERNLANNNKVEFFIWQKTKIKDFGNTFLLHSLLGWCE